MVSLGLKLVLVLGLCHAILCPFTKVEESFNTQAVHDILFLLLGVDGKNTGGSSSTYEGKEAFQQALSRFDHHEFPGVVPRTFVGAWIVSLVSWPALWLADLFPTYDLIETLKEHLSALGLSVSSTSENDGALRAMISSIDGAVHNSGCLALIFSRIALTVMTWTCLAFLGSALGQRFGRTCEKWFGLVCAAQFHLVFYLGRPLPNTFAMGLASLGLGSWIKGDWRRTINYLAFCTLVFRCDTLILSAFVGLLMLVYSREASFQALVIQGILASLLSLALTTSVDSVMWDRPLWPEGSVLFFNTVLNKSNEWGVMPWHWYATSALPRALLVALPLAPLGALQPLDRLGRSQILDRTACAYLLIPATAYVVLYSLLPHKELRFLFQVIPLFNALAALAIAKLQDAASATVSGSNKKTDSGQKGLNRLRKWVARVGLVLVCVGLGASWLVAQVFFAVSVQNYPGAHALLNLQRHHIAKAKDQEIETPFKAHYCVFAAMSGISRFVEHGPLSLQYSKQEDPTFEQQLCTKKEFDYLVMEVHRFKADAACAQNYRIVSQHFGSPKAEPLGR